jgi:diacylglycerol kinase (ATP)
MRAAAILALSLSEKDLRPFQSESDATWLIGIPVSPSDAAAILVFGGDGTVHRHLAQLVRLRLPVLVVPHGSGNDFARALNLGSIPDSLAAWRKFSSGAGNVRTIDLGVITPLSSQLVGPDRKENQPGRAEAVPLPGSGNWKPETGNSRYFCCVGGVGIDAETARPATHLPRWLRGHGGYALSLPSGLLRFAPFVLKISRPDHEQLPDNERDSVTNINRAMLAVFANAPAYGGGIRIAPHARLDDGKLDICIVASIGKLRLLRLFPSVYFGRHLGIPQVEYFQTERVRLETEQPMDVYADGEYVCRTPVEVSVEPAILKVIVPPSRNRR